MTYDIITLCKIMPKEIKKCDENIFKYKEKRIKPIINDYTYIN